MLTFDDLIKVYKLRSEFGTLRGLVVTLSISVVGLVGLFSTLDLSKMTAQKWVIICSVCLFILLLWLLKRLPRGAKDKMTIGLAVYRETSNEDQFYKDFLLGLKKNLRNSKSDEHIEIIEFPLHTSEQIYTNKDLAKKLMRQCRIDLLFIGNFFERETSSGLTTMMDMSGIAKHRQLSEKEHAAFQRTFSGALPQRYKSDRQNRFNLCEFAAQHVHGVTNAIIGITVLLNGKFETAETILLEAEKSLKISNAQLSIPYISQLIGNIKEYLHDLYVSWMLEKYNDADLELDKLEEVDIIIKKAEAQNITPKSLASFKAQVEFLLHNDVAAAKDSTKLLKEIDPAIYYYNMAFLSAYEGNLDEAYRHYANAFNQNLSDALIPWQCEEFIQKTIALDAEKKYLYFCTGLINFRAKNDSLLAKKDFQTFLEATSEEEFPQQREAVKKWISDINTSIS